MKLESLAGLVPDGSSRMSEGAGCNIVRCRIIMTSRGRCNLQIQDRSPHLRPVASEIRMHLLLVAVFILATGLGSATRPRSLDAGERGEIYLVVRLV